MAVATRRLDMFTDLSRNTWAAVYYTRHLENGMEKVMNVGRERNSTRECRKGGTHRGMKDDDATCMLVVRGLKRVSEKGIFAPVLIPVCLTKDAVIACQPASALKATQPDRKVPRHRRARTAHTHSLSWPLVAPCCERLR